MRETQKTERAGCRVGDRVEPKEAQGAQSTGIREAANGDSANGREPGRSLLEAILNMNNMFKA